MKKISLLIFLFLGCKSNLIFNHKIANTNKCKEVNSLYYFDNYRIEKEINQINGCNGVAEAIRNNFFFNKFDSVYVLNFGFFIHGLMNDYYDCLSLLSRNQLISLFGPPHFESDGYLYYIIKNGLSKKSASFVLYPDSGIPPIGVDYYLGDKLQLTRDNIDNLLKCNHFKEAKYIRYVSDYKVDRSTGIREICARKKDVFDKEIFYNAYKKHHIVNLFLTKGMESMDRHEVPCLESFTKNELELLFGKPNYIKSDTLFYILYDKPIISREKKNSHYNGMYYSVFFNKVSTNLYKFNLGAVRKKETESN